MADVVTALILGNARTMEDEANKLYELFEPDIVIGCNNAGMDWQDHVDHLFTLHPTKTDNWPGVREAVRRRRISGRNIPITWSNRAERGIDYVIPDWRGSTGLLAVNGALNYLECRAIVLAGVPMAAEFGHYGRQGNWKAANLYRKGWKERRHEIAPFVRSMSGWTRELFGEPTLEWLDEMRRSANAT